MNKLIAVIALSALLTACGSTTPETSNTTTSTTRTPRITDDSGRPDITFDPCLDIPDHLMNAAGYNAAKKELSDYPMGTYTFLGCRYDNPEKIPGLRRGYSLTILAGNVTLQEEFDKNNHMVTAVKINDRPALLEVHPESKEVCKYVLETKFGVVMLSRILHSDHAGYAPIDLWCEGFEELVVSLEPLIDHPRGGL